jgi:hypothetical protein
MTIDKTRIQQLLREAFSSDLIVLTYLGKKNILNGNSFQGKSCVD